MMENEITKLRKELEKARANKQYSKAAKIREEINKKENE